MPEPGSTLSEPAARPVWRSVTRGFAGKCPNCGKGQIFCAYLKVNRACPVCGLELSLHRADDAPPYITILIVGHVVVGLVLATEGFTTFMPVWLLMSVWSTCAVALSLLLLPRIKGALVGYQWALGMHGFDKASVLPTSPAG